MFVAISAEVSRCSWDVEATTGKLSPQTSFFPLITIKSLFFNVFQIDDVFPLTPIPNEIEREVEQDFDLSQFASEDEASIPAPEPHAIASQVRYNLFNYINDT